MSDTNTPLRLNVGFIAHQTIGYSHDFNFNVPELLIEPDLHVTNLVGVARITRTPQGLLVQVKMHANAQAECVRCLEPFSQPIVVDYSELYAFNKRSVTDSGLILPENGYINLGPVLREYMLLEIPISTYCQSDCKGLCPECGTNLNLSVCEHFSSSSNNSSIDVFET